MEKNMSGNTNESFNKGNVRSQSLDAKNAILDKTGPAMDYLKENFGTVRETTEAYLGDAEELIKRHPFYALAGAAAVGAIFGMMISRPTR